MQARTITKTVLLKRQHKVRSANAVNKISILINIYQIGTLTEAIWQFNEPNFGFFAVISSHCR